MLGHVETTAGPLRPYLFSEFGLRYRLGNDAQSRFHAGIRISTFIFQGPYQRMVDNAWKEATPNFFTAGPAFWVTL